VWPGLLFGELLFSRSGVRVRAGARYAVAGVADRSTLYDVFLRRHRETIDGSVGWGHNSQWKTDFRRDYVTLDAYHLNVDGNLDAADVTEGSGGLSAVEIRDLLRHRCLVRDVAKAADLPCIGDYRLTIQRAEQGP
jgi:hypothetical protein